MPVSKSMSRKAMGEAVIRAQRENAKNVNVRAASTYLPNVKGRRYVRDESKSGIVSKMIDR